MKLPTRNETPTGQLRNAAIEAALSALPAHQSRSKNRPALTGPRAVATGVVLYTAGRAVFTGRRFLREQLSSNQADDEEATQAREVQEEPDANEEARPKPAKPKRKPARRQGSQPSLELPQQRWPRMAAGRR